jgi:hypothetical protein
LPLATSMDVSVPLMIGALLSASSSGSHACFYSDPTVLVAPSTGTGEGSMRLVNCSVR